MIFPDAATVNLVDTLLALSEENKVHWTVAPGADAFEYVGSEAVAVIRSRDEDGTLPFIFELFDSSRSLADALQTGWSEDANADDATPYFWNESLAKLYRNARRIALRIDVLAGSILRDVENPRESS